MVAPLSPSRNLSILQRQGANIDIFRPPIVAGVTTFKTEYSSVQAKAQKSIYHSGLNQL